MSVIHVRHIRKTLEAKYDGAIDLSDWDGKPVDQRTNAFLSRALAAYAIEQETGVGTNTAAASVTDGFNDNGLDALYFDPAERTMFVVQSKWIANGQGSPSTAEVGKLVTGFRDLINARWDRFNEKIRVRQPELEAALDDTNVTFELLFVHTGQDALAEHSKRLLDDLLVEVNDTSDVVSYRALGQSDVYSFVKGELEGGSISLEVVLKEWGIIQDPYTAYYGQIQAEDVSHWWFEYGPRLFSRNLRKFIPDSDVNNAITESLVNAPESFWYFNNGITVLAERIAKKPLGGADRGSGSFVCEGVTVVNGAQTVGCIGAAAERNAEAVRQARVGIRFISLEDSPEELANEVTRATNTQNRIERRDFVSLDPEQDRLRTELRLENGKIYTIKTGEEDPAPENGCSVTEATIALACAIPEATLAVTAKREVGRLWEDIERAPYRRIFNPDVSGLRLWRSVEIMRSVEKTLQAAKTQREGRARGVAVHANRLILHLVFRELPVDDLGAPELAMEDVLQSVPEKTERILDRLYELVEAEYSTNYLASLFKNARKCRWLVDKVVNGDG